MVANNTDVILVCFRSANKSIMSAKIGPDAFSWAANFSVDSSEVNLAHSLVNEASYIGKKLTTDIGVPGRLASSSVFGDFYEHILLADLETCAIVRHGYVVPFEQLPPKAQHTQNNKSCRENMTFALAEIHRLESLGCVKRVPPGASWVEIPLSVVYSNKLRLVVDASRHINPFVKKRPIKLDSLEDFAQLVNRGDFVVVDDLDSGYWHVPLAKHQQHFFGCSIFNATTGEVEHYQWQVLFLGISDAVHVFTKVLRPVVQHLRKCGWLGIIYIDDLGTVASDYLRAVYWKNFARDILGRAGWIINTKKEQTPSQSNVLLGSVCDTLALKFRIPENKVLEVKDLIV